MSITIKDGKWLRWAHAGAQEFSTCSKGKYMAIVVGADGHVLGTGYNGGPKGMAHCIDGGCPRAVNGVPSGTPYDFGDGFCIAIHAEQNALLHSDWSKRAGGTLYVNGTPCVMCARTLANSGLARVVYLDREQLGTPEALWIMEQAGLVVESATWLDIGF